MYAKEIEEHRGEPGYLADLQVEMSSYYSLLNDKKATMRLARAQFWVDNKEAGEKSKSDAMLENLWLLTENGQAELKIRTGLDSLEKMLSAIKSSVVTASIEAKNTI